MEEAQPYDTEERNNNIICYLLNCPSNTEARTAGLRSNFRLQFSNATGPTSADFARRGVVQFLFSASGREALETLH
jgi:hypothetical protein